MAELGGEPVPPPIHCSAPQKGPRAPVHPKSWLPQLSGACTPSTQAKTQHTVGLQEVFAGQ